MNTCDNPECPKAGYCGGECARKFNDTHNFKPGDRLRSLRSGRIWIMHDTKMEPPEVLKGCIPVRHTEWAVTNFVWQDPQVFEKAYDL